MEKGKLILALLDRTVNYVSSIIKLTVLVTVFFGLFYFIAYMIDKLKKGK